MKDSPRMEDMFNDMPGGESLHDEKEIKRLFLEGSKVGKNIIKKEAQLVEAKALLIGLDMSMPIDEMKERLVKMYSIYETGKALETKMGYLARTKNPTTVLGICYNLVASKLETLDHLKSDFETEIQGY